MEHKVKEPPSAESIIGLNAVMFCISYAQIGLGPFLSIYLQTTLNWEAAKIGLALALGSISGLIVQMPAGAIIDNTYKKRLLIFMSLITIIAGCLLILLFPYFGTILLAQTVIGIAATIIPTTIAAISLGLVGRTHFPKRITMNEAYNHAGNITTAFSIGMASFLFGHHWMIYIVIGFALAGCFSLSLIKPSEIDHDIARASQEGINSQPVSIRTLLTTPAIIIFCLGIILYNFSNGAQLPLVGEMLAKKYPHYDALFLGSCIILARLAMFIMAYSLSFFINQIGRKKIFLFAFFLLPTRALLYTLTDNPFYILTLQLLDGFSAGVFGVVSVVTVSDLAKNSGRFNFSQGLLGVCLSTGVALSNIVAGIVAEHVGFKGGFYFLALIGAIGYLFYLLFMPETRDKIFFPAS